MESNRNLPDFNQFNIEKYFQYVKMTDFSSKVDFENLKKIITHHNNQFPYHNTQLCNAGKLPITEREVPSLDKDSLFHDMIKNHGGYCFQQLELLHSVIRIYG